MSTGQALNNQKNSLNRLALKAGLFYVICELFVRGITFITTPIYTRLLSTAQYGEVRVYESWLLIAVPVMSLCLWKSAERSKYDVGDKYHEFVGSVQTLSYIAITFFFGICMMFKTQVQAFCHMTDSMFYIAFAYIFTYTSVLYMQRREKQMMRYKVSTAITMLTMVPATVISIALLYIAKNKGYIDQLVELRIAGFYIPQIIGGFIVAIIMWVQGKKLVQKSYWKYAIKYSVPLIPEAISVQIMNQADKIMIQFLVGNEYTGIFALGTTVSYIIWILEDSVWNAWLPWMYTKISEGQEKEIEKPWTLLMHVFGLISWYLVVLAPEIVKILGDKEYYAAVYLIAPMVTGVLYRFYTFGYTAISNYYKKTNYVAIGTVISMIINVILNYVCIVTFGYQAAAYTTTASYLILLLIQGWLEWKISGRRLIPLKKTIGFSIGYLVLNMGTMLLFTGAWYIRYGIIIVVTIALAKWMLPKLLDILKLLKKA